MLFFICLSEENKSDTNQRLWFTKANLVYNETTIFNWYAYMPFYFHRDPIPNSVYANDDDGGKCVLLIVSLMQPLHTVHFLQLCSQEKWGQVTQYLWTCEDIKKLKINAECLIKRSHKAQTTEKRVNWVHDTLDDKKQFLTKCHIPNLETGTYENVFPTKEVQHDSG